MKNLEYNQVGNFTEHKPSSERNEFQTEFISIMGNNELSTIDVVNKLAKLKEKYPEQSAALGI